MSILCFAQRLLKRQPECKKMRITLNDKCHAVMKAHYINKTRVKQAHARRTYSSVVDVLGDLLEEAMARPRRSTSSSQRNHTVSSPCGTVTVGPKGLNKKSMRECLSERCFSEQSSSKQLFTTDDNLMCAKIRPASHLAKGDPKGQCTSTPFTVTLIACVQGAAHIGFCGGSSQAR